ncbi:MAG: cobalamin-binding domain-containing protein [Deltaproteobacteria bacterium]|nr:cobalamin-binding domain-containing protein [Deltaproteobacteria bacterium]
MPRNILLVEPGYPTKFPPLGLMKISTYHKALGDTVKFVKGYNAELAFDFWDRIYISTLFTYHWKVTIDDILSYKHLLHGDISRMFIGGILASLMPDKLWRATGIKPITGVLNRAGILSDENDYIIEDMIPDYKLFNGTTAKYTLLDSYFGYSTRGCIHKCDFCGVPILEPSFVEYKDLKPYIKKIDDRFGVKQHLVLFDNNILASKHFNQIIKDIIDLGFQKGAKLNDRLRHVDFNQGTDARLIKEWHFKLLSQIAISPLRIAFDHVRLEKIYVDKIRLAAKYGIKSLSNYILYNFKDTPDDLWNRLKINIDLNRKYGLKIYSFPMKYIPINAKDRSFIDEPRWNWYFIRSVQRIMNVTKGVVMPGEDFFYRAYGESLEEFMKILYMPEEILMKRGRTPGTEEITWFNKFNKLTANERNELLAILCENRTRDKFKEAVAQTKNTKLKNLLEMYLPKTQENCTAALFP